MGAPDRESLDHGGFGQIGVREQQPGTPGRAGGQGHGEGTSNRPQIALESHLAQDQGAAQPLSRKLAAGHQQSQGDWKIESGTILAYICRC